MWESRYGTLQPNRSEGNTRYYDGQQLRRLLNIVSLMKVDYKVSELSNLSDQKLYALISSQLQSKKEEGYEGYCVDQLIASAMTYDEVYFDKIFSHCLLRFGVIQAYTKVLYPMLERVGFLWSENTIPPAREHFLANLVRQKLFTAIDALPPPKYNGPTWLLFLPEDEFHEIGLLFAHYLLKSTGHRSVYLGSNVPVSSVHGAVTDLNPGKLLFFLVHYEDKKKVTDYLAGLKSFFKKEIYIAGHPGLLGSLDLPSKVKWLQSTEELQEALDL